MSFYIHYFNDFSFSQGITNKRNDYNDAFERLAAQEAQREFFFYFYSQKRIFLLSFFIFLKYNYAFDTFLKKAVDI